MEPCGELDALLQALSSTSLRSHDQCVVLAWDIFRTLEKILTSTMLHRTFLACRGRRAQSIVDALQWVSFAPFGV